MQQRRVPTISDVARLAGVSTGTVSRVLNRRPGVRPETRERVLAVVERLGYVPMAAARELSGHTNKVGGAGFAAGVEVLAVFHSAL